MERSGNGQGKGEWGRVRKGDESGSGKWGRKKEGGVEQEREGQRGKFTIIKGRGENWAMR